MSTLSVCQSQKHVFLFVLSPQEMLIFSIQNCFLSYERATSERKHIQKPLESKSARDLFSAYKNSRPPWFIIMFLLNLDSKIASRKKSSSRGEASFFFSLPVLIPVRGLIA